MRRAIGVMAVLAIVTIAAAVLDDDPVLTASGCPVGTDRWSTVAIDFASGDSGYGTKTDAVRAWLREANLDASNGSVVRAIDQSEREADGAAPVVLETTEGLPAVLTLEIVNGGWFVTDASLCRRRAAD